MEPVIVLLYDNNNNDNNNNNNNNIFIIFIIIAWFGFQGELSSLKEKTDQVVQENTR